MQFSLRKSSRIQLLFLYRKGIAALFILSVFIDHIIVAILIGFTHHQSAAAALIDSRHLAQRFIGIADFGIPAAIGFIDLFHIVSIPKAVRRAVFQDFLNHFSVGIARERQDDPGRIRQSIFVSGHRQRGICLPQDVIRINIRGFLQIRVRWLIPLNSGHINIQPVHSRYGLLSLNVGINNLSLLIPL